MISAPASKQALPNRIRASLAKSNAWRIAPSLLRSMPDSSMPISNNQFCVPMKYEARANGPVPGQRMATSMPTALRIRRIASSITGIRPSVSGSGTRS
jgi:hypothetical protein